MNKGNITICICASRSIIDKDKVVEVSHTLSKAGYTVAMEADLCEKAITSPSDMKEIASTTVVACYPRAVNALFDRLHLKPAEVVDIRNGSKEDVLSKFDLKDLEDPKVLKDLKDFPSKKGEDAWFPVLDRERCSGCGKCYDFCLFGVYTMGDGEVEVTHPANCKINCPACARTCPSKAVIFPKYPKSPINGGLEDEETVAVNQTLLYNDALRYRLSQRRAGVSLLKKN
ncbi:hypothetical protein FACS189411_00460 [Bacteroidia bacterium]|nr:hypothetical protein FACS189411_00460 [Bacteroidia bacterium]